MYCTPMLMPMRTLVSKSWLLWVMLVSEITGHTATELKALVPDGRPAPEPR